MKMSLKVGTAVALLMAAAPMAAFADSTTTTDTTNATATQTAEVDAGKLIGQDVVDANGDTIGEIDSVMVDAKGKVQGVVIDVSSWLESEKLISMPWTDLQVSNDDKVVATNLTKESAAAATTYAYVDPAHKGKVFTDEGMTDTATGADTDTTNATAATTAEVDAGELIGENVVDANGDTVGEIDSVMVDAKGKVQGVVIDVSSWLESEKLISMPWTDLQVSGDDKIVAGNLTKESATAATTYAYADPANKGKVFTDDTMTGTGTGTDTGMALGTPIMNGDGSINASQLMGLKVENPDGDNVGEIGEVILDDAGKVQGVVVDVGGFLGVGEHPVLMDWKDVELAGSGNDVKANVTATVESLKAMPTYERAGE
jgi:sporulation protein YlmC with PRC-barrel domain